MFLPGRLHQVLGQADDEAWQDLLRHHDFWQNPGLRLDAEHDDIAFHILLQEGELARASNAYQASARQFDAVAIPDAVFNDAALEPLVARWAGLHARNFGPGLTVKMGLYVIRAQGTLGFHVDGPVFLRGERVDLSVEPLQRGLLEAQASRRTVLPLRFNDTDRFMVCQWPVPLHRGELFEFSNVLPHAYFNQGPEHAVLLVTTYLVESLLPAEFFGRILGRSGGTSGAT